MIHRLIQENYDSSNQIISITEDNQFSGQVITRFEVRHYPGGSEAHDVIYDLLGYRDILSLDFIYKQICRLSKKKGDRCTTYEEASRLAG